MIQIGIEIAKQISAINIITSGALEKATNIGTVKICPKSFNNFARL